MDCLKELGALKKPVLLAVAVTVVYWAFVYFAGSNGSLLSLAGYFMFFAVSLAFCFAGYSLARKTGGNVLQGAAGGFVAALAATAINSVFYFASEFLIKNPGFQYEALWSIIGFAIIWPVYSAALLALGLVFGAIGGQTAKKKNADSSNREKRYV